MPEGTPRLLSIITPVYRQEKTIVKDLRAILAQLDMLKVPYELIVVVDGMEDRSYDLARKHIRYPNVIIVGYPTNHGKGYAVRFGMAKCKGDVIGFIDAGGDLHAEGLSMMLEHFRWYNADIIIGSKRHPVSKVTYPFYRRFMSWVYQMLIRLLFGLQVKDSQVGMKLYKRVVLEDVLPRLIVKKFAFDIEILAVANHLGYKRIFEAPVELDFSSASTITSGNFWRIIFSTLLDTFAVYYRLQILRYYDGVNKRHWRFDPELNFRVNLP